MNIFILDKNVVLSASYHCDKHIVKMLTETCQILSTVYREVAKEEIPDFIYKATHKNHPCVKWCRESRSNFIYCIHLGFELYNEYQHRYNKPEKHKRAKIILDYLNKKQFDLYFENFYETPFALAMPEQYKSDNTVEAYRAYYCHCKNHLFKWTKREIPPFVKEYLNAK